MAGISQKGRRTMKKLLFITKDTDPNNQNFLKEISQIFSGYISIEFFCSKISDASHMKPDIKDVDIILSTNPYTLSDVRRFIGEDTKIIMLDFTFRKDLIEALQTFPPGTEALPIRWPTGCMKPGPTT